MPESDGGLPRRPALRRLVIFEAAARRGSMGAAAGDLGITQPATTHALSKLEDEVGVRLLDRGAGGSSPTEAGRILLRRIERMLHQMEASLTTLGLSQQGAARCTRKLTDAQIRCHLAIANAGSFRLAAAALGLAEPTLNRAARSLEAAVDAALYERRPRGVGVSEQGSKLAADLRLALLEIDQGLDELQALRGVADGRLSLGCLPLMPKGVLARAVGELLRAYPNAAISLEEASHGSLIEALRTGRLDMALGALQTRRPPAGMKQQRLFPDPYVVVASPDHPLAGANEVKESDLALQRWIVPWRDTPRRRVLDVLFTSLPSPPHVVMETSSMAMMGAMLAESASLTVLSSSQLQEDQAAGNLVVLPVRLTWPDRAVGVLYRAEWLPTRVQQAFLAIVCRCQS